jgi:pyrroline-5-carboxylate reductase
MAVANIGIQNQQAGELRLGLLGAGRLGEAIAKRWLAHTGEAPLVWSRRGQRPANNAEARICDGTWVAEWTEALKARSLVVAIPGRALLDLAEDSEPAKKFAGNIFSAAASLSRESLRQVFPMATIVCIAPFLIYAANSIPMLVFRPPELPDLQWEKAKSELLNFGDFDVVQDEDLFAHLSLLGAPWPVVVLAAIQAAAGVAVKRLHDEAAIGIGRRVFFRAMQSLLSTRTIDGLEQESSADIVATPGGITERGLKNVDQLASLLESVFEQMQTRANELRA